MVFFFAFLAIQLVVPALKLAGPDDHAFGWQMYSVISDEQFTVRFQDGSEETIDPREYVLHHRSEVDYRHDLPPFLCDRLPDSVSVVTSSTIAQSRQTYRCP